MEGNGVGDQKILTSNTQVCLETKSVGQSKFYDVASSTVTPEKQDIMKPDDYSDDIIGKAIIFIFHLLFLSSIEFFFIVSIVKSDFFLLSNLKREKSPTL